MSPAGGIEVIVNLDAFGDVDPAPLDRAARLVLRHVGVPEAEISVTLLDDAGIAELNARWLGKDGPTDVLAFSLGTGPGPLGDVYVGAEQARRQAEELGEPFGEELVRLVVHGVLHVLGHDHPEGPERTGSPMFELQEALVRRVLAGA